MDTADLHAGDVVLPVTTVAIEITSTPVLPSMLRLPIFMAAVIGLPDTLRRPACSAA